MLPLTSCLTSGPDPAPSPSEFCAIAEPIILDPDDRLTMATKRLVVTHNEKGKKLCGWKPPGARPG